MTLPPRLPDLPFEPDPDRARSILATARRRRRTQAGALGLSLALAVGIGTLSSGGGASGLRVVDPTTEQSGTPAPSASPHAEPSPDASGSPSPGPGHVATTADPSGTPGPGEPAGPSAEPSGLSPSPAPAGPEVEVDVTRETIDYDATRPCDELQHTSYANRDVPEAAEYCLRYSWPATVAYGDWVTFTVEQCAVDGDMTARWSPWPQLSVGSLDNHFDLRTEESRVETLRGRTCWRWTVRWNAVAEVYTTGTTHQLPRGTHAVEVDGARANEQSFASFQRNPNRQQSLTVS